MERRNRAYKRVKRNRGAAVVRYADDIVVLAKSKRAAERLLGNSRKYLKGKLKLKLNAQKSKVVSLKRWNERLNRRVPNGTHGGLTCIFVELFLHK